MKIIERLSHEVALGEADAEEIIDRLDGLLEAAKAMAERGVKRLILQPLGTTTYMSHTNIGGSWVADAPVTTTTHVQLTGERDTTPLAGDAVITSEPQP